MRHFLAISALAAFGLSAAAAAQPAAGVFKPEDARAFCAADAPDNADSCFAEQREAALQIEKFLESGVFTRPDARRAYVSCEAVSGSDLRRTWLCLQDRRDKFRNSRDGGRRN